MKEDKLESSSSEGNSSSVALSLTEDEGKDSTDNGVGQPMNPVATLLGFISSHKVVEIAVLGTVIAVVWGVLCLPVVFYHVTESTENRYQGQQYPKDGRCYSYLLEHQDCYMLDSDALVVAPRPNAEQDLQALEGFLGLAQASPECVRAALSFTCLYLYPLSGEDRRLYEPSAEQCRHLSDEVCVQTWELARQLGVANRLPNCDDFMEETLQCVGGSAAGSGTNDTTLTPTATSEEASTTVSSANITCREGFGLVGGVCEARCDSWEQSPHGQIVAVRVIVILAACLVIIAGCAVVIISCFRRKNMLVFPTVFLVYMCIGCCVIAFFVLVNYMDQDGLFCGEMSVEDAVEDSTPFCTLSGVIWQYCLLNITLCWLFHVSSIFWKVVFPIHARQYQRHQKYFHVVLGMASLLLPVPSVIAAFATEGYSIIRFPPLLCGVRDLDTHYYSLWLVLNILLGLGISLLIITFWEVHKHQGLFRAKFTNSGYALSSAEKKLLLVFAYYIVFASVTLIYYSLTTRDTDKFIAEVEEFFVCERFGYNSEDPCPKDYEKYRYPVMEGFVYILMAFIPTVSLVFIVHVQRTKKEIGRFSDRVQSRVTRSIRKSDNDHPDDASLEAIGRDSPSLTKTASSLGLKVEVTESEFCNGKNTYEGNGVINSTNSPPN